MDKIKVLPHLKYPTVVAEANSWLLPAHDFVRILRSALPRAFLPVFNKEPDSPDRFQPKWLEGAPQELMRSRDPKRTEKGLLKRGLRFSLVFKPQDLESDFGVYLYSNSGIVTIISYKQV